MARQLKYGFELEQEMRPQENEDDKNTKCFKKKEPIPQHVSLWVDKFPLKKNTDCEIDRIPKANEEVGLPPYSRYVLNNFHQRGICSLNLTI